LSGTFQSARAALRTSGIDGVHLFDSRSASLGLGMLGLRASELAESGWSAAEIVKELDRVRRQSGMFLSVDTYDNLIR
jgi:fatty acid-binding protein DegV